MNVISAHYIYNIVYMYHTYIVVILLLHDYRIFSKILYDFNHIDIGDSNVINVIHNIIIINIYIYIYNL